MQRTRDQDFKKKLRNRMQRINGQTLGILKMIEEDRYCIDILNQINAVQGALTQVALQLFEDHSAHCLRASLTSDSEQQQQALTEVIAVLKKMMK